MTLADRHVITGVPVNDWELHVPSGVCIDVVPVGDEAGWHARTVSMILQREYYG